MQLAQQGIILSFVDRRPAILSVDAVTDISVSFNTEFFEVVFRLPIQVMVNTSDGNSELMTVTWNEGSYNEAVAGVYTILGTITPSSGVRNPLGITAEVDVTVEVALSPSDLANQIMWLRENTVNTGGQVDNWINNFNSARDMVKITDARRPGLNATGIEGSLTTIDYLLANSDILRCEGGLGLTADYTIYMIIKVTSFATTQIILQNADNDVVFGNTGIMTQVRATTGDMWVDFRKNVSGSTNQQRVEFPYNTTAFSLVHIKHDAAGAGASINVVKQDGALIKKNTGMEPVVHNSNTLKIGGTGFDTSTPFGGSIAEVIITSDYHDAITEASVIDYFKTRYPTELGDIAFFDETKFRPIDSVSEAWNGLDAILRGDGKYDFVAGTLTGKIYYLEQGATINDWTTTLLVDTLREIQSLKVYGRTSANRLVLLSAHKDSAALNDNIGKIMVHYADTTDDQGAYTSATPLPAHDYPQQIVVYDIDNDGENEFIFSFQGGGVGEGGVSWFKFTDINAPLGGGTEHVCIQHSGAWWIDGPYDIGGTDRWIFSARNNRNPGNEVPGLYYLTPASPVTNTWAETTIDNSVIDFGHWSVGNIFGNTNDIVIQNFSNDDIYAYNGASAFAESTIITGASAGVGTNLKIITGNVINGRSSFLSFTENDWAYLNYWNGSAWARRKLFQTLGHPADNEIFYLDIDNSGFLTIVFDDNTNLANANVRMFRL
jgi:hypothetical protein